MVPARHFHGPRAVLAWALRGNFMGRMTVLQRSLGGTVTCADALHD